MSAMKESSIQSKIIKWINAQPGCIAENVRGNAAQSGRADINACIQGRCMKIEVKRPDSNYDVTPKQKVYMRKWALAHAYCCRVESLDEVKHHVLGMINRWR